jgi:hypothetical protein
MAAQSASLTINVIANAAKAKAGFKEAEKSALSLKGQFDDLRTKMMGKAGVAMGLSALGAFALDAVGKFTALAKSAGDLGKATGLSTEEASRWIAVADDFGLAAGDIQTVFKQLNKDIDDVKWAKYGIAVKDAGGKARKSNDIFLDTLDVLNAIEDPTQRARVGTELLGKAWGGLAPLVGESRQEYERMLASVSDGQVITQQEYEKAERMRLAQDALSDAWGDLQLAVGEAVANMSPVLDGFAVSLGVVAKAMGIIFGGDAASIGEELSESAKRMAANSDNVFEMATAFDSLAVASLNGRSSWGKAVEGMDRLTLGITTMGDSQNDVDRTAAALKSFNAILADNPKNALATAKALKEVAIAANDPNSPKWMREMDDAWNLNEETIDGWIGTAQGAITEEEELNRLIAIQNDLVDGLTEAWEDYLGLLDIESVADDAQQSLLELAYAIDDPTTATNEFAEAQKQAAEDVAQFIKQAENLPKDIQLEMLADLQSGDLAAVYKQIQDWKDTNPDLFRLNLRLNTATAFQSVQDNPMSRGPIPFPSSALPAGAFTSSGTSNPNMNVTVNMPAGANGAEVVRALQTEARRIGQLLIPVSGKTQT